MNFNSEVTLYIQTELGSLPSSHSVFPQLVSVHYSFITVAVRYSGKHTKHVQRIDCETYLQREKRMMRLCYVLPFYLCAPYEMLSMFVSTWL